MSARPRIALVGAGNMGSHHARVISQSPDADLAVLVDPREEVGRAVADRFGAEWAPELPDLGDLDAVVVAAATEAHFELAMQVLSQDRPLLIEKPVADSLLRTEEILAEADRRDLPIMCGLLERWNPAVMAAKSVLREPIHIRAMRHSPYAPRIRTGVSWDLLVHDVDLAIQLFGTEPTDVSAQLGFFHPSSLVQAEDVAEATLAFANGGVAQISASRIGQHKVRSLTVHELDRLIEVDLLRRNLTVYRHVSEASVDDGMGFRQQTIIEIPEIPPAPEPLTAQFTRFLELVESRADAAEERAGILPSHRVIDHVIAQRARA
ncbi:Gfo/Idh/MocA family oxidoreductase [Agromyces protaetiae]|uniref:Gfo/Idh/MocA family oxidoreductase n=1 Tax=Agromyces protaetiae TaxID=2509455 RepID=A0A4P6FEI1_9MICO|nr:Gfo/Idh/MocA family oxidoreductase [Agromyces protaetiae]QAY74572.1 Gfo/Idh/MocA family oxidoreductase [Agromyces protaetiae]